MEKPIITMRIIHMIHIVQIQMTRAITSIMRKYLDVGITLTGKEIDL